jgi:phenylpyruvate tautomerase PptA (4-oxalocrotonate tautomerase family)
MPMIDLTYLRGSVEQQALEHLADELVTALLRAERAPDTGIEPEGDRAFHVWTLIHEIPEGNWAGGGKIIYYRDVKGLVADDAP